MPHDAVAASLAGGTESLAHELRAGRTPADDEKKGVERAGGAPEGRAWRHLLDAYVSAQMGERLKFYVQGNAGFEPNNFGLSSWGAGAAAAQVKLSSIVSVARSSGKSIINGRINV